MITRTVKSPPNGPGLQTFVKSPPPPGLHAIQSALNLGFGRVKSSLCPGAREQEFQLTDALQTIFLAIRNDYRQVLMITRWSLKRTFCHVGHALRSAGLHRARRDDNVN